MNTFTVTVFSALCVLQHVGSLPQPSSDRRDMVMTRHTYCTDLEYQHGGVCCLNCEAGEYVKAPCTEERKKGTCEECMFGTFTEHPNGLNQCFKCTQCRPDQEVVRRCTPTQDTQCQCKPGRYCHPDEACEVCKKCSRCKSDEVIVRNCTSTTNTECKKIQPRMESSSDTVIVLIVLGGVALVVFLVGMFYMWRRRRTSGSQRRPSGRMKPDQHNAEACSGSGTNPLLFQQQVRFPRSADLEDESKTLVESCSSSATNSQQSLLQINLLCSGQPAASTQPNRREDEPIPILVPLNGVESLRSCFDLFGELDVDYHKRFFRGLGLSDNVIKSKEHLTYEDKVHELLNIWVEQEGRNASLNDLLKVLLDLNQRRTAETVKEKAIQNGYYCCEP